MNIQYKHFYSHNEADLWVKEHNSHFPSDSDNDKIFLKALEYYTASGNPLINNHLRYHLPLETDDFIYPYATQMINRLPSYHIPDNIIVYRYISIGLMKEMCSSHPPKRGTILTDKGFMSTTLVRESINAYRHSNRSLKILLEISVPIGTKGTYVGHLKNMLHEYEVILAPNTQLRIDYKFPFCNRYFKCTVINQ